MFWSFFEYWDRSTSEYWQRTKYCNYCLKLNLYSVEDEFHVLLVCPLYSNLGHYVNKKTITKYFVYLKLYIKRFYKDTHYISVKV